MHDFEWDLALQKTEALIAAGTQRLYQPTLEHNDIRIRVDILGMLTDRSVTFREVKMSTRLEDEHLLDIAGQVQVIQASGYPLKEAFLVNVNNKHCPGTTKPLFAEVNVTNQVLKLDEVLTAEVGDMPEIGDKNLLFQRLAQRIENLFNHPRQPFKKPRYSP